MSETFREEFRLANLGLSHRTRSDFIVSHWKWHPSVFIAYRVMAALYATGFFITAMILLSLGGSNDSMAYLTIWTYLMLTLYFLLSAIVAVFHSCMTNTHAQYNRKSTLVNKPKSSNLAENGIINIAFVETDSSSPTAAGAKTQETTGYTATDNSSMESLAEEVTVLMKICWVLGNIVQVFAIVVTVVYFTALFPLVGRTNCIDINFHGVNSFFVLLDTCLTARPVRLLHVIHPVIYGSCYLIFSAIYWSFDHVDHVLYPGVLDWNYPGTTMIWVAGLTLVVMPVLQLFYYGAHRLKLHVSRD